MMRSPGSVCVFGRGGQKRNLKVACMGGGKENAITSLLMVLPYPKEKREPKLPL